jgi:6-pyruvoyltetrahydropterin/6-carboxytetrahydropterin synthase
VKIAKEFKWEMGHRLTFHKGKCKNLHGHTYRLWVEIGGKQDSNGLVMDYYDLSKQVSPIIEKIDHSVMVYYKDLDLIEALTKLGSKIVIVEFESTAENICKYLINELKKTDLPSNINSLKVRIYETDNDFAEDEFILNS